MQANFPRVGVAVLVVREGRVLVGLRKGTHGAGTWAVPGGSLEFGESIEACARREVLEETGLELADVRLGPYVNTIFPDEARHSVTLFVLADAPTHEAELREPEKCAGWEWCAWDALPEPLFATLAQLKASGYVPYNTER